jgi:hypothetical protein
VHPRRSASASKASPCMAYHRADPRPFAPRGFHSLEIAHREMMTQAVVCHPQGTHEDFAIVSIAPFLQMQCNLEQFKKLSTNF